MLLSLIYKYCKIKKLLNRGQNTYIRLTKLCKYNKIIENSLNGFRNFAPVYKRGAPEKRSGSRVHTRLEDTIMFKKAVSILFATVLTVNIVIGGKFVAKADENENVVRFEVEDPFGDPGYEPKIGTKFQFAQDTVLKSLPTESNVNINVEVTPHDMCYIVSKTGRGACMIYVEGMDPSIRVYTNFWADTEYTVIQENALIRGDMDADAHVNAIDLALAKRLLIENIRGDTSADGLAIMRADFNADSRFNIADLVALQRFLLGYKQDETADEVDYIAVKSVSPYGFAGSSAYVVSLFDNGDLTVNSKLYATDVIDVGLDVSGGVVIQGGEIIEESQKSWINQSNETPPPVSGGSSGITVKPTGFSGCSQHFACLTPGKDLYVDGEYYAYGVEKIYVETDATSPNFGAVMCVCRDNESEWYDSLPGWVSVLLVG